MEQILMKMGRILYSKLEEYAHSTEMTCKDLENIVLLSKAIKNIEETEKLIREENETSGRAKNHENMF